MVLTTSPNISLRKQSPCLGIGPLPVLALSNPGFSCGDFALELYKRFSTEKSGCLQGAVYKQLTAKGVGKVSCLVAVQVLCHTATMHSTA